MNMTSTSDLLPNTIQNQSQTDLPSDMSSLNTELRGDSELPSVHGARPESENVLLQSNISDDDSDNETTACMSSSSDSTIVVPLNLEHYQIDYPLDKTDDRSLSVPLHSFSTTHLKVMSPPMPYSLDSKSETNSVFWDICKICHQPSDPEDPLISPCRCAGTLQYIHGTCLTVSFKHVIDS